MKLLYFLFCMFCVNHVLAQEFVPSYQCDSLQNCQVCMSITGIPEYSDFNGCVVMSVNTCADPMSLDTQVIINDDEPTVNSFYVNDPTVIPVSVPTTPCTVDFILSNINRGDNDISFVIGVGATCKIPLIGTYSFDPVKITDVSFESEPCPVPVDGWAVAFVIVLVGLFAFVALVIAYYFYDKHKGGHVYNIYS
eukprot:TRINITY_DN11941_c0_g1_i1.p1 TRINITY_DN11941_c0_g1~~TRINITY_DN11941_c0_g1_i1.p1  ORF type:complete len:194 (+),score=34.45 TRINITY_DN11941_c0_g1_i1:282-863(+)